MGSARLSAADVIFTQASDGFDGPDAGMAEDQEPGLRAAVIGETPSNSHRLGT